MTQEDTTINIKPNELMLGDYVAIKCADKSTVNIKVSSIGELLIAGNMVDTPSASSWAHCTDLQPIPLTSEILEKNGFPYDKEETERIQSVFEDYTEFYKFPLGNGFHIEYDTVKNFYRITDHCWICFKYVHEFQHVLRLCGIDKEIIL